ncbi:hypothetical protein PFICI_09368 [Pestalotiopsis fici W106-1]|uniref:Uncharacterized protein n=1 Tax=Pestalotiopsis fici (strain W106-1 / CGMCC3.15140) TaxID=1229662 RepID=W3X086_PESFW|nr:uncharacterized protein PFICI_09368 [Pestalotiopsis fici W106-1]ETS79515.1 hypothetical protein PFICI_09368 [Pestalotiopsis fici W106-1]
MTHSRNGFAGGWSSIATNQAAPEPTSTKAWREETPGERAAQRIPPRDQDQQREEYGSEAKPTETWPVHFTATVNKSVAVNEASRESIHGRTGDYDDEKPPRIEGSGC